MQGALGIKVCLFGSFFVGFDVGFDVVKLSTEITSLTRD
jgi:hypothetical protein